MAEQSESEHQAWWRPRLETIAACSTCVPVLKGFAQKIIKEQQDRGRWPEHDAADFVHRAARKALQGKVKRPQTRNENGGQGGRARQPRDGLGEAKPAVPVPMVAIRKRSGSFARGSETTAGAAPELKGREIEDYAAANDISVGTAERHLKDARRDLRVSLRDYRPDDRGDTSP